MKKRTLLCIIMVLIVILAIAAGSGYYYLQQFSQKTLNLSEDKQLFSLKRGTSLNQLAKQLQSQGLIDDAYLLPYLVRINPSYQSIKAGTYQLSAEMTVADFLALLTTGKEVQFTIQFIEGKSAKELLTLLESVDYIEKTLNSLTYSEIAERIGIDGALEGWLYPDTYHYTENTTDLAILKRAYQKMQSTLQATWDNRDADLPYKTPYEMLIMASIIEKETGIDSERKQVASVFFNRLKYKMKLQTDPTVIYGLGDKYTGRLLNKDTKDKTNPYNTYYIFGLPPTPIAMPSLASLEAAAHPAKTNYLYFVADGYGGHVFSKNYRDHQTAVAKYWALMRSRNKS